LNRRRDGHYRRRLRYSRARFNNAGLNRPDLDARLFGWCWNRGRRGGFCRLYRWQAEQYRIDAQRHGSLRLRLIGISTDQNARKAVKKEQREWFAPDD
jgi:hypothetical protein